MSGSPRCLGKALAAADDRKPTQTLLPNDEGNSLLPLSSLRSHF